MSGTSYLKLSWWCCTLSSQGCQLSSLCGCLKESVSIHLGWWWHKGCLAQGSQDEKGTPTVYTRESRCSSFTVFTYWQENWEESLKYPTELIIDTVDGFNHLKHFPSTLVHVSPLKWHNFSIIHFLCIACVCSGLLWSRDIDTQMNNDLHK